MSERGCTVEMDVSGPAAAEVCWEKHRETVAELSTESLRFQIEVTDHATAVCSEVSDLIDPELDLAARYELARREREDE